MDQQRETQKDSGMSNFQHDGVTEAPNFGTPAFVEYWLSEANMPVTRMINEFNSQMASMKSLHKEEMEAKEKDVEHWKDQADKETKACNKIIETKTMEVVNAKAALAGSKMNLAKETEKLEKLREEFETNTALLNNKLKGKEIKLQEVIKERDQYKVLYESSQEKMDDAKKFAEQLHISLEEITGKSKSFVDHVNFGLNEGELEAIQGTSQAPNNHSIHALPKPLEFDQAVGKSRKTRRKQVAKPNSCEQVANLQLSRNTKAKRSKCDRGSLPPPAAPRKARRNPARKGSSTSTPAQDDPTFYHFNQAPPHGDIGVPPGPEQGSNMQMMSPPSLLPQGFYFGPQETTQLIGEPLQFHEPHELKVILPNGELQIIRQIQMMQGGQGTIQLN